MVRAMVYSAYDENSGRCRICGGETLWGDAPHEPGCEFAERYLQAVPSRVAGVSSATLLAQSGNEVGPFDYAILKALDDFWREHCYPPTIRDIMRMSKTSSTSLVFRVLQRLAEWGCIAIHDARPIPLWVIAVIGEVTPGD